jgi:allantoicase
VTIFPDGGIKRLRIVGRRAVPETLAQSVPSQIVVPNGGAASTAPVATNGKSSTTTTVSSNGAARTLSALPLTAEAFASYGSVLQSYPDHDSVPKGTRVTPCNQGTAAKFHHLAPLIDAYPTAGATAKPNFSVFRCEAGGKKTTLEVKVLERHRFTTQAFVPMAGGVGSERYLVIVALNGEGESVAARDLVSAGFETLTDGAPGEDDKPDLSTLRAFVASTTQGISYGAGVWREF